MAVKPQKRGWRIARRIFRWFRIGVWLLLLAALILAVWLNRVGLPEFLKVHLVFALREHGMDVQFTRMRLIWYRGIVAENIDFGRAGQPRGLRAAATEADLRLRLKPLLHRQFDVTGVTLRGGHLIVPIWGTNDTPRQWHIAKVSGELRFLPNDQWELNGLRAETFGVSLVLNGTVTNASAVRRWRFGRERPKARTPQAFWHDLVWNFEQTKFEAPSEIRGVISGDARDLGSFRAQLNISSPAIDSPLGRGRNLKVSGEIAPQPGKLVHAEVKLQAEDAITRWGDAASVQLEAQLTPSLTQWAPTNAHMSLQVKRAVTPWASGASFTIKADFRPNPSEPGSSLADYAVRGQQIRTRWTRLAQAELIVSGVVSSSNAWPSSAKTTLKFAGGEIGAGRAASGNIEATLMLPPSEVLRLADTNVSFWSRLDQMTAEVSARFSDVHSPNLDLRTVSLKSSWRPPLLSIQQLDAAVQNGTLRGSARLDATTRRLSAEVQSDLDPHKVSASLMTNSHRWLSHFTWEQPPRIFANVSVVLPAWTNQAKWTNANWSEEVLPSLQIAGHFQLGAGSFNDVPISAAQSDFTYSNRTWRLPNFVLKRPEGAAYIAHVSNERARTYQFVIDSGIDPRALGPFLDRPLRKIADEFTLTSPPIVRAEISGRWDEPAATSFRMSVAATNLGFRAQPALACRTLITLTNQILTFAAPEIVRTEGTARADSIVIDFPRKKLFINDATGSIHPAAITKCIHPKVEQIMAPYRFINAPHGHVWGVVDLEDEMRSDLHFDLAGGPFQWRAFRFQQITGNVHWAGTTLSLSNITGFMHGGVLEGSLLMDFNVKAGADFAFRTRVHNINLNSLIRDVGNPTNKLEGWLSGQLVITNANTEDLYSWFGYGNMDLQDGLIWEVPVFGIFSPLLNAINPGAGNNKAKEATATFIMTNSVIFTSDLSIRASGMRLNYDGTVDFDTRINGTMQAELFRNTPGIGEVVSKVFWPVTKLFEYRVTGTFSKPKQEPLYIPKIFMMPFHPLRTMRELIEGEKSQLLPPRP